MTSLTDIKAFAFDVDGVFTGGGILCDVQGELYRTFDSKDGFGVRMAIMHGYPVGVITGGRSRSITARFLSSGVPAEDVYLGSRNKMEQLDDFCRRHSVTPEQVLYIGDDIPDLAVIQAVGIGMCPADAVAEVREAADIVSEFPGGRWCVRNAIESVMRAQGTWTFDSMQYKKLF